jgi:hypothetical protein
MYSTVAVACKTLTPRKTGASYPIEVNESLTRLEASPKVAADRWFTYEIDHTSSQGPPAPVQWELMSPQIGSPATGGARAV